MRLSTRALLAGVALLTDVVARTSQRLSVGPSARSAKNQCQRQKLVARPPDWTECAARSPLEPVQARAVTDPRVNNWTQYPSERRCRTCIGGRRRFLARRLRHERATWATAGQRSSLDSGERQQGDDETLAGSRRQASLAETATRPDRRLTPDQHLAPPRLLLLLLLRRPTDSPSACRINCSGSVVRMSSGTD